MKFILLVEGPTEQKVLPEFLKRWLDPQLSQPIRITPDKSDGWAELVRDAPTKVRQHLEHPTQKDIIAVIALLDLYGPDKSDFYPSHLKTAAERHDWAKQELEKRVGQTQFRQFFAVHELEAWLLSDPKILPTEISNSLPGKAQQPETVNFNEPPAQLLDHLYNAKLKKDFKKTVDGVNLFRKLDPTIAYDKCPYLKAMLDEMLSLAQAAGL
ncbi:MAG: DUF4276 family protein [Armatimonadota bacterium]|nr:DUF4276 family protein [Armatimonadota bacterium]